MGLWEIWRAFDQRDSSAKKRTRPWSGKAMGYLERRLRRRRVSQACFKSYLCIWLWNRTAQQVSDRLDELIKKIYKIQGPYMHGEKPADVILVCSRTADAFVPWFIHGSGRSWSFASRFCQTLAQISDGDPIIDDDGAWRDRNSEACDPRAPDCALYEC